MPPIRIGGIFFGWCLEQILSENWNDGYVTEVAYTHGYYRELSPSLQRFALLCKGYASPAEGPYLELGFGQGLSACIHSAATACQVWGTDFNPTQAANARSLASAAGLDAKLFDDSFEQLLERSDLPDFQFIGAHGIWTWVSHDVRRQIVELLRRKLSVGGAAYLSYNTLPGWSASYSLRHLLTLQAEVMGTSEQGIVGRVANSIEFAKDVASKGAIYFKSNPMVTERLTKLAMYEKQYLAHEYFNRDWLPMHFAEFMDAVEPAKLEFAASANLLDHVDTINLLPDAQEKLKSINHPGFKESVRDYFVNQQFRRDILLRGVSKLSLLEQREALMATSVALLKNPQDIKYKIAGVHEVSLQEEIYRPLVELFAVNKYRPHTLAELARHFPKLMWDQLLQAVMILVGAGDMHPVQAEGVIKKATPKVAALNREICKRARGSAEISFLASPVIGAGVPLSRFELIFLGAKYSGKSQPKAWVEVAWATLLSQGQKILKEGKALDSAEENIAELEIYAEKFAARLPILMALGVA